MQDTDAVPLRAGERANPRAAQTLPKIQPVTPIPARPAFTVAGVVQPRRSRGQCAIRQSRWHLRRQRDSTPGRSEKTCAARVEADQPRERGKTTEDAGRVRLRQSSSAERTQPSARLGLQRPRKQRVSHQASDMERNVKGSVQVGWISARAGAADGPGQRRWVRLIFAGRDGMTGNRRELPRSSVAGHRVVPHRTFEGSPCGGAHPLLQPARAGFDVG